MSISIRLPDGSERPFDAPPTGTDVALSIGAGLAKAALAIKVNGELRDLTRVIEQDADVEIITGKSPEALELLRHDAAHVMAEAVQELYPDTQVTIGPAIENGFYYDFARDEPFKPEDLEKIEAKMREIVKRDEPIAREVWDRNEAIEWFKAQGEAYKAEIIADLPEGETITVYRQGQFVDLCRGPHLPSTGKLGKAFKLMKLAGAYWRGDSNNAMLQRIYGTAWTNDKELKAYLTQLEEAEKRDHRRLGKQLDLFHIQDEAVGQVFWHPKGYTLFRQLEAYVREKIDARNYVEVKTPLLMDRKLWEASGHWDKYRENMFIAEVDEGSNETRMLAVKPMNCPGHVQLYANTLHSYRDLPLRMAEFGACHRYEPSGALHGLMRVRGFIMDDAHIFCTPEQLPTEAAEAGKLIFEMYRELGFDEVEVKLATRPEQRIGSDAIWDRAESELKQACEMMGVDYVVAEGDGAFYGPKLEFTLYDAIGRGWQCGTVQVDFNLPERFGIEYVAEDGSRQRPAMLHRAILGSLERFIGILIEQYAGALPLWLAPVQVAVTTIVSDADDYAREVVAALKQAGIRAELDIRNEKINRKIREHSNNKVPAIFVLGRNEAEEAQVTIRRLGQKQQKTLALAEAIEWLQAEIRERRRPQSDAA
ncbi:threonine--tRNA ligase [Abyssibacter profundi]|uniref:Threonine--tRNA ligase n=1 Tax=Abyssibacter profundi TaxID=2182787 RepID=A0A363UPD6_9GAMM|nr:threonine--tRNA ligase [Abyssibacter profundi]PWN57340.1 threonine--tRNA ligase [Abyssibacter profundi]